MKRLMTANQKQLTNALAYHQKKAKECAGKLKAHHQNMAKTIKARMKEVGE